MAKFIVFDVNETLLDLSVLDKYFKDVFKNASVKHIWFAQSLQTAMALTLMGKYKPFSEVCNHALHIVGEQRHVKITKEHFEQLQLHIRQLPAYPEVPEALEKLVSKDIRIAALTNSDLKLARAQLGFANLNTFFKKVISVDAVRKFKPAKEVYEMTAAELAVYPEELILVTVHEWDINGAISAGLTGAFVKRPGSALGKFSETPKIIGKDLVDVVDQIIASDL